MADIVTKLAPLLKEGDTEERCGFVTKRGRIVHVPNIADDPKAAFRIDPAATLSWLEKGAVATWHTHPYTTANLSGEDYECFCVWDNLVHYVIGRRNNQIEVATYRVEDGLVVQA